MDENNWEKDGIMFNTECNLDLESRWRSNISSTQSSAAAACAWQYQDGWSSLTVAWSFDQDGGVEGQAKDSLDTITTDEDGYKAKDKECH